jgi:hypothetical protein
MTNKEIIIFRVPNLQSEDDLNNIKNLQNILNDKYEGTNQIPLVITNDIDVIKYNEINYEI